MVSYHEHSKPTQLERILTALADQDVALVSEAGTPLLSDPGYKLVQAAIERGVELVAIPGPSAILTALPVSGLSVDQFLFVGFLPRKPAQRRQMLDKLKSQTVTLIFFEAPHRLRDTLVALAEIFGERKIALCRELTKLYEEIWRGTTNEACTVWSQREPKGEFTLVVAGATENSRWNETQVREALLESMATGKTTKDSVKIVTNASGWSKREVYTLAEKVKNLNLDDKLG
jgi:16S rRNA (cytidine1402-2'-O)-methyltransferase